MSENNKEKELSSMLISVQQEYINLMKLHIKMLDDRGVQLSNEMGLLRTHYEELYRKYQEVLHQSHSHSHSPSSLNDSSYNTV